MEFSRKKRSASGKLIAKKERLKLKERAEDGSVGKVKEHKETENGAHIANGA